MILFHYPILEWEGYFGDTIHLYGHVHNSGNNMERQKYFEILGKRAVNVGVDVNNYFPINIKNVINKTRE
jgi:calcineurin-like phosphoesterase family protein